ncbi:MAG: 8-amino-7-oxononanoate synthase [Candidatus Omnitrophota bacterium]
MNNLDFIENELTELKNNFLFRELKLVGEDLINFSSNDYLGLCSDERLKQSAIEAIKIYGAGTGASRLISGTQILHQELEEKLAKFKGKPTLVFNSGYAANLGIISSLANRDTIIFSDKLNHASIVDGIMLSQVEFKRYKHNDINDLEEQVKKYSNYKRKIIVTDTVFSMDGDLADLKSIVKIAKKYDCITILDEAHATGVFGKKGSGLCEELNLEEEVDIQMGTLSKAAGSFGAYVSAKKAIIDYLVNKSRAFIYTTSLPSSICAASIKAIGIIESDNSLRKKLWDNVNYFKEKIAKLKFNIGNTQSPIIPIIIGDANKTLNISKQLFKKRLFVQAIRPPTVPKNLSRLRIAISARHKKEDLNLLTEALCRI